MTSQQPAVNAASSGSADVFPDGQTCQPKMEHNSYLSDDETSIGSWSDGLKAIESFDWGHSFEGEELKATATVDLHVDEDRSMVASKQQKDFVHLTDAQQYQVSSRGTVVDLTSVQDGMELDVPSRNSSLSILALTPQSPVRTPETTVSPVERATDPPTTVTSGNDLFESVDSGIDKTDLVQVEVSSSKNRYDQGTELNEVPLAVDTPAEHFKSSPREPSPSGGECTSPAPTEHLNTASAPLYTATDGTPTSLTDAVNIPSGYVAPESTPESPAELLEEDVVADTVLQCSDDGASSVSEGVDEDPAHSTTNQVPHADRESISFCRPSEDPMLPQDEPAVPPSQTLCSESIVGMPYPTSEDAPKKNNYDAVFEKVDRDGRGEASSKASHQVPGDDSIAPVSGQVEKPDVNATMSDVATHCTETFEEQPSHGPWPMQTSTSVTIPQGEETYSSDVPDTARTMLGEGVLSMRPDETSLPDAANCNEERVKLNSDDQALVSDVCNTPDRVPSDGHNFDDLTGMPGSPSQSMTEAQQAELEEGNGGGFMAPAAEPSLLKVSDASVPQQGDQVDPLQPSQHPSGAADSGSVEHLHEPSPSDVGQLDAEITSGPVSPSPNTHKGRTINEAEEDVPTCVVNNGSPPSTEGLFKAANVPTSLEVSDAATQPVAVPETQLPVQPQESGSCSTSDLVASSEQKDRATDEIPETIASPTAAHEQTLSQASATLESVLPDAEQTASRTMMPPPAKSPTDEAFLGMHERETMPSQKSSELSDPPSTNKSPGSSRRSSLKVVEAKADEEEEEVMDHELRKIRSDPPEPSSMNKPTIQENEGLPAEANGPDDGVIQPVGADAEENDTDSNPSHIVHTQPKTDEGDQVEEETPVATSGLDAPELKPAPAIPTLVEQSILAPPTPIPSPSTPGPVSKSKLKAAVKNSGKRKRPAPKASKSSNKAFKPGPGSDSESSSDEKPVTKKKKGSRASTPGVNFDKATPRKKNGKFAKTPKGKGKAERTSMDGAEDLEMRKRRSEDFDISSDKEEEVGSPLGRKGRNAETEVDDHIPDASSSPENSNEEEDIDQENRPPSAVPGPAPAPIPPRRTRRTSVAAAAAQAVKSPKESPTPAPPKPKPGTSKRTTRAASAAAPQTDTSSYVRSLTPTDLNTRYDKRTTRSDTKPNTAVPTMNTTTATATNTKTAKTKVPARTKTQAKTKATSKVKKTQTQTPVPKQVIPSKRKSRRSSTRIAEAAALANTNANTESDGESTDEMQRGGPQKIRGRRHLTRLREMAVVATVEGGVGADAEESEDEAQSESESEDGDEAEDGDKGRDEEEQGEGGKKQKKANGKGKDKSGKTSKPPHKIRTRRVSLVEERDANIGKRLRSGDKTRNSLG